jgi:hypothetical protein
MKVILSRVCMVAAVLCVCGLGTLSMSLAGPPVWTITNPSFNVPWVYVGPSKGTAGGGAGMNGQPWMDSLCQSTYGNQARMCTSDEVLHSTITGPPPVSWYWVNPSISNCVYIQQTWSDILGNTYAPGPYCYWPYLYTPPQPHSHPIMFTLISEDAGVLSCGNWLSTLAYMSGAAMAFPPGAGGYQTIVQSCGDPLPVACCVPPSSALEF